MLNADTTHARRGNDEQEVTRGYPAVFNTFGSTLIERNLFDALPDAEKASIEEWYNENSTTRVTSAYSKWYKVMNDQECARVQKVMPQVYEQINELGYENHGGLVFNAHKFAAPLIQGFGDNLTCGICNFTLPKTEEEYIQKSQNIICEICQKILADSNEVQTTSHPSNHRKLLTIPSKREWIFIPFNVFE